MSSVTVRVELPTYSYSFTVQVDPSSTILGVKQQIFSTCPGQPHVEGQKAIWRGRYLANDERISDIWKSPDEQRVIHLSVHPTAWTSLPTFPSPSSAQSVDPSTGVHAGTSSPFHIPPPPTQPDAPSLSSHTSTQDSPFTNSRPLHFTMPLASVPNFLNPDPLTFVQWKHDNAIQVLMDDTSIPNRILDNTRAAAVHFLQLRGYQWPSILDQPFPAQSLTNDRGLVYDRVVLEGCEYLTLRNAGATPTARQVHALKILSYTFSILKLPPASPAPIVIGVPQEAPAPWQLNEHLQQLGFLPLRAMHNPFYNVNVNAVPGAVPNPVVNPIPVPNPGADVAIRDLPIRAILVSLTLITLRTLLLLYFISPTRKPLIGLCILAWIAYEAWNHIRLILFPPWNRLAEGNGAAPQGNGNPMGPGNIPQVVAQGQPGAAGLQGVPQPVDAPNANPEQARAAPQNRQRTIGQSQGRNHLDGILSHLALTNIDDENQMLWPAQGAAGPPDPSLAHKLVMFCNLLLLTLHPAIWNRRRAALRQRESRLRTEMSAAEREAETSEGQDRQAQAREQLSAQHERRPRWVREYVQRVRGEEWIDD